MKQIERDANGLITETEYPFTDNGLIDWRKMIRPEFLVANKDRSGGETDVTKLKDYQLIILLGGIKELAQIRGYTDVRYDVHSPSPEYVVATCSISWIPNYETEGREVTFSSVGDASPNNTKSFARHFLGPIAENRSFVRCVRNFLKINIVAQEELGNVNLAAESEDSPSSLDPRDMLSDIMKSKGIGFDTLKDKLIKEKFDGADVLSSVGSIPKIKCFELIERMKKAKVKSK
jgi:hypothetical protein